MRLALNVAFPGILLALVLSSYAEDARGLYEHGTAQFDGHDFNGAASSFQQAINADASYAPAYKGLGMAQFELKNYQGAYQAWLEASKLNPGDAKTKYLLGRLFYEADLPNEAASWLREALKLAPNDIPTITYLGLCAEAVGLDDTARDLYRNAVVESRAQTTPFSWAYLSYGNYLKKHGNDAQAILILEEGEQKCPEARELTALGELLSAHGQTERAEEMLRRAVALDPSLAQPHYRLALLLKSKGKTEESRSELASFQDLKSKEANSAKVTALRRGTGIGSTPQ